MIGVNLVVERAKADPEQAGGLGAPAAAAFERRAEEAFLRVFEVQVFG